jgi:uncharacterized protein (DUF1800 family)
MARSDATEAVLALNRFGMGPRPGSIAAIASDPRGALIAEVERFPAELSSALPSSAKAFRMVNEANARRQAKAILAKKAQEKVQEKAQDDAKKQQMAETPAPAAEGGQGAMEMAQKTAMDSVPDPGRPIYLEEAQVRIEAALAADIGFAERLVWFWSNHFCISADKIRSMSGA